MKTIEIQDESMGTEEKFQLYINGAPRACVVKKHGDVQLIWQVHGPQYWPDAQVLLQGILELSVIASKLSGDKKNGH